MGKFILNGKTYTGNSADGFPPLIYSDDEREIGVWRDGKPLYEKTIDVGYLPSGGAKYVNHDISNLGIVVSAYGFGINASGTRLLIPNISTNSTHNVQLSTTDTQIVLQVGMDRSSFSGYVTLQYTKTTDTAGSGHWATSGDRAIHYSTAEQVIGTWIDGKPLYEKTFNQNTPLSLIANSWGPTNIAYSEISAKHIVNATLEAINNSGYPVFNVGFNIAILNGYVNLNSFRNVEYNNGYTLTMQYTKTTD